MSERDSNEHEAALMRDCYRCGIQYQQRSYRLSMTYCIECERAYRRERYHGRKLAGLPNHRGKAKPETKKATEARRRLNPEFAAKRREEAARRRQDPVERIKMAARRAARTAEERGDLIRKPCEDCGAAKVQRHHEDYSKPLEVTWLCVSCHAKRHAPGRIRTTGSDAAGGQR